MSALVTPWAPPSPPPPTHTHPHPRTSLLCRRCRADSIVRDAELVRRAIVPQGGGGGSSSGGRWSALGQSFGGFCAATYLSLAPEGLVEVLITGGLPPGIADSCSADDGERGSLCGVVRAAVDIRQNTQLGARSACPPCHACSCSCCVPR